MRVKTLGSYMMPTRPDVIDMSAHQGMRGLGGFNPTNLFVRPEEAIWPFPTTGYNTINEQITTPATAARTALVWPEGGASTNLSYMMARNSALWLFGTFAAGWIGGYLTWRAIGRRRGR